MAIKENIKNNLLAKILSRPHLADFLWIFSFSILTAVAARITIPVEPVPFTLQTMIVLLSGAFLGGKKGAYSQLIYLGLGVLGFPVFAQIPDITIGFARLFGPTGGYLLSFPLAAFVAGYLVERNKSYINFVFSMLIANIIILLIGSIYLGIFFFGNIVRGLETGAVVFLLWEVIKDFVAATIYFGISKRNKKIS